MSEPEEELELQALQRQLDDAMETTRPRPDFEDELWLRMQTSRPAPRRLGDAFGAFFRGVREVPAVPMAAVAAVLVVVVGVGILAYSGLGRGGGGATSSSLSAGADRNYAAGNFGRVPTPVFNGTPKGTQAPQAVADASSEYFGPAQLTWTGKLELTITAAPVFRYHEPSTNTADQFATALGAVLRERPAGFLGSYSASDYTLKIRGTVQSPQASPAFFIFASLSMPAIEAAGAGPKDIADIFLAQHSLSPQWSYTVAVDSKGDPVKVLYERQFDVPGSGPAYLIDGGGKHYGIEVDLSNNRPVLVSGFLPVNLDVAPYKIVSASDAVQSALASGGQGVSATPAPAVKLTQAELVYVLVPAGDHSFYEPAFLFSGSFQLDGKTVVKRVLVPAIDPTLRTP